MNSNEPTELPCPTQTICIRAPGKAFLIGEYGVLHGGPAVVAAVGCYAHAWMSVEPTRSPYIRSAQRHASRWLRRHGHTPARGIPLVHTKPFYYQSQKLGLGSSAAVTVCAVGLLFATAGLSLDQHRDTIRQVAQEAHNEAQHTQGSGADVAAITWGGYHLLHAPAVSSLQLPSHPVLVSTAGSQSTKRVVHAYRALGQPALYLGQRMSHAAAQFLDACARHSHSQLCAAVEKAFETYHLLAALLQRPLISPAFEHIRQAARGVGGAAKPSGAGGGDIAIAFLPSPESVPLFQALLPAHSRVLPYALGTQGLHQIDSVHPPVEPSMYPTQPLIPQGAR